MPSLPTSVDLLYMRSPTPTSSDLLGSAQSPVAPYRSCCHLSRHHHHGYLTLVPLIMSPPTSTNLNLHNPYDGLDDVVIGDGTGLHITHSGSISLSTPSRSFTLQNVLCVPNVKRNLISISQFCKSNKTFVEFLPSSFHVKDLQTGAILIHDHTKDGVYEWPTNPSTSVIAFSSVKASPSDWHH